MRFGTAIERLVDNYQYAKSKIWIRDEVAWALYHTWKEADDRKTENSSEIPNNCEVKNYCDDCLYTDTCDSKEFFYACTSKATISKMEQVDKDINVRSKDEPQTDCAEALTLLWINNMVTDEEFYRIDARLKCISCKWWNDTIAGGSECVSKECTYQPKDEPQTDCAWR